MEGLKRMRHAVPAGLAGAIWLFATHPAAAHHVMEGRTPATLLQGLLSGLGHPIIGPDHLAFLVAVGVVTGVGGLSPALPLVFVAASALGVMLHAALLDVPAVEILVALSVLLAGMLLARGRPLPAAAWAALFGIAGLFHGYAYGEAIVGAEPAPFGAYLVGLVVIQGLLSIAVALVAARMHTSAIAPRLVGAAIAGVGFAVLVANVVPGA
jgi:urease accessory protein